MARSVLTMAAGAAGTMAGTMATGITATGVMATGVTALPIAASESMAASAGAADSVAMAAGAATAAGAAPAGGGAAGKALGEATTGSSGATKFGPPKNRGAGPILPRGWGFPRSP